MYTLVTVLVMLLSFAGWALANWGTTQWLTSWGATGGWLRFGPHTAGAAAYVALTLALGPWCLMRSHMYIQLFGGSFALAVGLFLLGIKAGLELGRTHALGPILGLLLGAGIGMLTVLLAGALIVTALGLTHGRQGTTDE